MKRTQQHRVSPIGTSLAEHRRQLRGRDLKYRRESARLEPFEKIARRVIRLRTQYGLTQEELAERVGTTASAISRLESGQHRPSLDTLSKLAHAYGGHLLVAFEIPGESRKEREFVAI